MFRKIILNVHLYGGLLCFSYLIIFGISSLNFNHPYEFTRARGPSRTWEQPIELEDLPRLTASMSGEGRVKTKAQANHLVRQELGLWGNQRPWAQSKWIDEQTYHASLARPGKEYEVDVHLDDKRAVVQETPGNVWGVMRSLHGLGETMPGSWFVSTWAWYTELCTFVVVFAGISGIYLWTRRRSERRAGYVLIGAAAAFSLALMLYITLHG